MSEPRVIFRPKKDSVSLDDLVELLRFLQISVPASSVVDLSPSLRKHFDDVPPICLTDAAEQASS